MAPSQSSSIRLQSPRELKAMIFWGSSLKATLKSSMAPWKSPWSFRSSPRLLAFGNKQLAILFVCLRRGKTRKQKKKRSWFNKKSGNLGKIEAHKLIHYFISWRNKSQSLTASWCFAENLLFKMYTSLLFTNDLCSKDSIFSYAPSFPLLSFSGSKIPPKRFTGTHRYRMHRSCALVHVAGEASRPSSSHQKLPGHRPEAACRWKEWEWLTLQVYGCCW